MFIVRQADIVPVEVSQLTSQLLCSLQGRSSTAGVTVRHY